MAHWGLATPVSASPWRAHVLFSSQESRQSHIFYTLWVHGWRPVVSCSGYHCASCKMRERRDGAVNCKYSSSDSIAVVPISSGCYSSGLATVCFIEFAAPSLGSRNVTLGDIKPGALQDVGGTASGLDLRRSIMTEGFTSIKGHTSGWCKDDESVKWERETN